MSASGKRKKKAIDRYISRREAAELLGVPYHAATSALMGLKVKKNKFSLVRSVCSFYRLSDVLALAAVRREAFERERSNNIRSERCGTKLGTAYHYAPTTEKNTPPPQHRGRKCPVCGEPVATGQYCCSGCRRQIPSARGYDGEDWGCAVNIKV